MGRPAICMSVLGEPKGWDMSRVSLPTEGITIFIKIPSFDDLTALGFKTEHQPQKPQIRKRGCYTPCLSVGT